jgi:hypothetical protein
LLKPFDKATKRAEGNATAGSHGALWEVIPTMNYLFNMLKRSADEMTARPSLFTDYNQHCLNHGFLKLQDYFTKIDDSRLNSAAVALNPCRRFDYFENAWGDKEGGRDMIMNAKRWTHELFEEYLERLPIEATPDEASTTLFIGSDDLDDDDQEWAATFGDQTASIEHDRRQQRKLQESELDRFVNDNTLNTVVTVVKDGKPFRQTLINEPLRWWRERGNPYVVTTALNLAESNVETPFNIWGRIAALRIDRAQWSWQNALYCMRSCHLLSHDSASRHLTVATTLNLRTQLILTPNTSVKSSTTLGYAILNLAHFVFRKTLLSSGPRHITISNILRPV